MTKKITTLEQIISERDAIMKSDLIKSPNSFIMLMSELVFSYSDSIKKAYEKMSLDPKDYIESKESVEDVLCLSDNDIEIAYEAFVDTAWEIGQSFAKPNVINEGSFTNITNARLFFESIYHDLFQYDFNFQSELIIELRKHIKIKDNRGKTEQVIPEVFKIYFEIFLSFPDKLTESKPQSKVYTMIDDPLEINEIGENIFKALSQENDYEILNKVSLIENNQPIVIDQKNLQKFKNEVKKARKLNLSKYSELKSLPKDDYNYLWDMITEHFIDKVDETTGFTITKRVKPVGY